MYLLHIYHICIAYMQAVSEISNHPLEYSFFITKFINCMMIIIVYIKMYRSNSKATLAFQFLSICGGYSGCGQSLKQALSADNN